MALRNILSFCIALFCSAYCITNEPFPRGFSMGSLGALNQNKQRGSVNTHISPVFMPDSMRFGISSSATFFFDAMDGNSSDLVAADLGCLFKVKLSTHKINFSHFLALGEYAEDELSLSTGYPLLINLRASLDLRLCGAYLIHQSSWLRLFCGGGLTLIYKSKLGFFGADLANIPLYKNALYEYGDNFHISFYGELNPVFGASSGCKITVAPKPKTRITITLAEALHLTENITLIASVKTLPFSIGMSALFGTSSNGFTFDMVFEQELGFSKGVAFSHAKY